MTRRRGKTRAAILLAAALCALSPALLFGQATTTVTDTVHAPDGSLPSGQIVVTANSTFTAADGTVVMAGTKATATVTSGAFSVALVPTSGSTPSGVSYTAVYRLAGFPSQAEIWTVPSSPNPAALSDVRTSPTPTPLTIFAISQIIPPSNCASLGGFAKYTSTGWTCASAGGGSGGGTPVQEQPAGTINGSNVTFTLAQTPITGTLAVELNGLVLRPGASYDYTLSGSTITFNYAPKAGSSLICWYSY